MLEEQLINIEIKISHHEHTINELNNVIYEQQKQIDKLEQTCKALIERIKTPNGNTPDNNNQHEIPPHY